MSNLKSEVTRIQSQLTKDRRELNSAANTLRQKVGALEKKLTSDGGDHRGCAAYMRMVLDPESHPPQRYPDVFAEKTSIYRALNNVEITPMTSEVVEDLEEGEFRLMVFPEIKNSIFELQEEERILDCTFLGNSQNYEWEPKANTNLDDTPGSCTKVTIGDSAELRISHLDDGGNLITSMKVESATGVRHNYFPKVSGSSGSQIHVAITFGENSSGLSGSLNIEQVDYDGAVLNTQTVPYLSSDFNKTLRLDLVNTVNRNAAFYIRVSNNSPRPAYITETNIHFSCKFSWTNHPLADLEQLDEYVEKYRIVAQSTLLTYMSEVLTAAGQVSGLLYRGGEPSFNSGVSSYSEIARHKDSYNGMLLQGQYNYWEPQDTTDVAFRKPGRVFDTSKPMILCSGVFSGTTIPENCLRLRVTTVIEFTSRSQMFEVQPSPVHPDWIEMANTVLSQAPNSMENGHHKKKLAKIASALGPLAKRLGGFLWKNRSPIMNEAMKFGSLFL